MLHKVVGGEEGWVHNESKQSSLRNVFEMFWQMYNNKLVSGRRYGMRYLSDVAPFSTTVVTTLLDGGGGLHAISFEFLPSMHEWTAKQLRDLDAATAEGKQRKKLSS